MAAEKYKKATEQEMITAYSAADILLTTTERCAPEIAKVLTDEQRREFYRIQVEIRLLAWKCGVSPLSPIYIKSSLRQQVSTATSEILQSITHRFEALAKIYGRGQN